MMTPDPDDPLKIRRRLALVSSIYALIVWPFVMIYFALHGLGADTVRDLLVYIGTLSAGPVGAYLWACRDQDRMNGGNGC